MTAALRQTFKNNSGPGSPGYVQLITVSSSVPVAAGSMLALAIFNSDTSFVTSVSDSLGNSWVRATGKFHPTLNCNVELWYCLNAKAGSTTISLNAAPDYVAWGVIGQEWPGVALSNALDNAVATAESSYVTSHTISAPSVNHQADELELAIYGNTFDASTGTISYTPSSGWMNGTGVGGAAYIGGAIQSRVVTAVETASAGFTTSQSTQGCLAIATFRAGAPTVPDTPTNLTATPGDKQITLDFSDAPGATSHNIYRSTVEGQLGSLIQGSAQGPAKVRFAQPTLVNPTHVYLTNTTNGRKTGVLDPTKDYIVHLPNEPVTVAEGIEINSGRNIVIVGGDISPAVDAGVTGTANRAIFIKGNNNQTSSRCIFIEGVHLGGILREGINVDSQGEPDLTVILQNIENDVILLGTQGTNHSDFVQVYNGPTNLLMDRIHCRPAYQAVFIQANSNGDSPLGTYDFSNMFIEGTADSGVLLYDATGSQIPDDIPKIKLKNVLIQKATDKSFAQMFWPNQTRWGTGASEAPAGTTSPCTGNPGLDYVSPGYNGEDYSTEPFKLVWYENFTAGTVAEGALFNSAGNGLGAYASRFKCYPRAYLTTYGQDPPVGGGSGDHYDHTIMSIVGGVSGAWGNCMRARLHRDSSDNKVWGAAPIPLISIDGNSGTRRYGRYETRIKNDAVSGFHIAHLLWNVRNYLQRTDPNFIPWPQAGEDDGPEYETEQNVGAFMHHYGGTSGGAQDGYTSTVVAPAWYTFRREWTPGKVQYWVNSRLIGTSTGSKVVPDDMQWILQMEGSPNGNKQPALGVECNVYIDSIKYYEYTP